MKRLRLPRLLRGLGLALGRAAVLKTKRLRLVPMTVELLRSDAAGKARLARGLRCVVTAEWPPEHWEPHVLTLIEAQLTEHPETRGWHRYVLLVEGRTRTLVGAIGGFPRPEGDVEIGYSTLPAYQRRGLGVEGVGTLVAYLLRQDAVRSVSAQTEAQMAESMKVMERVGMTHVGDGDDAGTVRYRRQRS